MKRYGNLFNSTFSEEALYRAYLSASKGKKKTKSYLQFSAHLGAELYLLREELLSGDYRLRPYRRLKIQTPKPRDILAPHFRDVVVQHAIYATIYPIFNRSFIHTSFACRKGKGTHAASDCAYHAMQEHDTDLCTLHLDVRRFFSSIDREILVGLLKRKIKDDRLLAVMELFCSSADGSTGIPLGNLLSQLYALIYLNPADHFIKRVLKVNRYVRYVDDMVLIGMTRPVAKKLQEVIKGFLADKLHLNLSKWSLRRIREGINFVGYRTWPTHRLIRKYSLQKFRRAVAKGKDETAWSIIAHAQWTSSLKIMKNIISRSNRMVIHLPLSHKRRLGLCCLPNNLICMGSIWPEPSLNWSWTSWPASDF